MTEPTPTEPGKRVYTLMVQYDVRETQRTQMELLVVVAQDEGEAREHFRRIFLRDAPPDRQEAILGRLTVYPEFQQEVLATWFAPRLLHYLEQSTLAQDGLIYVHDSVHPNWRIA